MPGRKSYSKQYEFWRRAVRGNLGKKETKAIVPASQAHGGKTFKDPSGVEYAVVRCSETSTTAKSPVNNGLTRWQRAVKNFFEIQQMSYLSAPMHDLDAYSKNDMFLINLQKENKADTDYTKDLRKQLIRERDSARYQIPPEMISKAIKAIERLPGPPDEAMIRFDNAEDYSLNVVPADALYRGLITLRPQYGNTNDKKPLYISLHKEDSAQNHRFMAIMPEDSHFAYVSDLYLETGSISLKDIHDISKIKEFNSPTY